jgi:hypothetical protein
MAKEIDKKKLRADMENLLKSDGWKVISKVLDLNIKEAEDKLNGEMDMLPEETIHTVRKNRKDRIVLRELPERIMKDCEGNSLEFPLNFDPYEE